MVCLRDLLMSALLPEYGNDMKISNVAHSLSIDLLRFVRDSQPTATEMLDWLGVAQQSRYHVLRKAGLLVLQEEILILSPQHLSPDSKCFQWEHMRFNIDEETIDIFSIKEPVPIVAAD